MKKTYQKVLMKGTQMASVEKQNDRPIVRNPEERNTKINTTLFTRDLDFETIYPKGLQITTFSEEEIAKLAVINAKRDEKEEKRGNFEGTILDNRMYPKGNGFCSTCFLPANFCPGHLARIQLVKPIINIWFYKYVVSVLESICHECGTLLLNVDTAKRFSKGGVDSLKKIAKASKSLPCRNQGCSNRDQVNPSFIKKMDNMLKIQIKYPNNKMGFIPSSRILTLFKAINPEELDALGFSQTTEYHIHPKNMIFTNLPVIPINHRPNTLVNGKSQSNSLTGIYHKIIDINNQLKNGIKDDRKTLASLEDEVCSIHYRDSESSKSGNPNVIDTSKNVTEVLQKKKGLIRNNAQAKRCDHTGRTVIGPGGLDIPFGWIRLPQEMKKILVEERICDKNIDFYKKQIDEGNVIRITTRYKKLTTTNLHPDFVLRNGMVVRRMLQEGDPVIFNRNPTLFKHSMMGYLVKFGEGLNIGIHSAVTTPHNADFDGDEANFHSCPGYVARAEIIHLSACYKNIMHSQFSYPAMGLVYNAITSAYLMSQYGKISDHMWNKLTSKVFDRSSRGSTLQERARRQRPDDVASFGSWKTGPVLFSYLFPENFYYNHAGVTIKEGILVNGRLMKKHVGPEKSQSIIHMLYYYYGSQVCSQFISEGQTLTDMFIEYIGFTVGYRDVSMPAEEASVKALVEIEMVKAIDRLDNIAPLSGNKNVEIQNFYLQSVQAAINKITTVGEEIAAEALPKNNSLKIMADSGAKGKVLDIAHIIGIVGQQFVRNGTRPAMYFNQLHGSSKIKSKGYKHEPTGLRFLPYYDIHREGRREDIKARGFVDRPLGKGMRPGQFFSHMMASRLGLIDTAFGTANTGYTNHTVLKALEDIRYSYNGTMCGDLGQIYQYAGGGDSYEPSEVVNANIPGYGHTWTPVDIGEYVNMLNSE